MFLGDAEEAEERTQVEGAAIANTEGEMRRKKRECGEVRIKGEGFYRKRRGEGGRVENREVPRSFMACTQHHVHECTRECKT